MTIKTVSIDAIQLDGFKIETRSRQHVALVDQPIAGGGVPIEAQLLWNTCLCHWPVVL